METMVIPLGSRGWMPLEGRQTMCTLVKLGQACFLLDCGTGVSRLLEPGLRELLGSAPLTILFSHYHLDHVAGLPYLPGIFGASGRTVRLAGPRAGFTQGSLQETCERLTSPPLSSRPLEEFPFPVELHEFGPEGFTVEGIPIRVSLQEHPGGSVALRIGDGLCYATDLAASAGELPIAEGVDCLLHEAWSLESTAPAGLHSGLPEAMERARRARIPRLVPMHFGPGMSEEAIRGMGAFSDASLQVIVPVEGQSIRPPGGQGLAPAGVQPCGTGS